MLNNFITRNILFNPFNRKLATSIMKVPFHQPQFSIPNELESFLIDHMKKAGCSAHDIHHCYRVADLAVVLSKHEPDAKAEVSYIAGLLHDILDAKLYKENLIEVENHIIDLLKQMSPEILSISDIQRIQTIIHSVGYKNLTKPDWDVNCLPPEYRCVQDADLIDAIGAIGIARCFAYSGKVNRTLFGMEAKDYIEHVDNDSYAKSQTNMDQTAIQHYFEKLLRLKNFITTIEGKRIAERRHKFMVLYLEQVSEELLESGESSSFEVPMLLSKHFK